MLQFLQYHANLNVRWSFVVKTIRLLIKNQIANVEKITRAAIDDRFVKINGQIPAYNRIHVVS